jgi:hypothetical protein
VTAGGDDNIRLLLEEFGLPYKDLHKILYQALSFYSRMMDSDRFQYFEYSDVNRDFVPCEIAQKIACINKLCIWEQRRKIVVPRRVWRGMKAVMKLSGDRSVAHMIENALKLYVLLVKGWLPPLYAVGNDAEFVKVEFVIDHPNNQSR